jgi:hypothetical protein
MRIGKFSKSGFTFGQHRVVLFLFPFARSFFPRRRLQISGNTPAQVRRGKQPALGFGTD